MTIRRTLLGAFFLVGLIPSIILTYLAFVQSKEALQREIEINLQSGARAVSAGVDHLLFERLQNAIGWSQLEVMQDIRIGDVDKRLSQFLAQVKASYGDIYGALYCQGNDGRIVAASDPGLIGRKAPTAHPWLSARIGSDTVGLDAVARDENGSLALPLRTAIAGSDGRPLGQLVILLDWRQVERILDQASSDGRIALLLGADAGVIAQSSESLQSPAGLPALSGIPLPDEAGSLILPAGARGGPWMAGLQRSQGVGRFPGWGWKALLLQPSSTALAAVQRMKFVFLALLVAIMLLTGAAAMIVAARIAQPITRLTAFTRHFARDQRLHPVPPPARGEVGELTDAFVNTMRDLERSRQDLLRASKLAVTGEIAAMMAHEIRTPLGILRSSAQVLRNEPGISTEGRELVGFIETETDRINRLVTSALQSAEPRQPNYALVELRALIARCVAMLASQAAGKAVTIEQTSSAPVEVGCDEEQLMQVILNLVSNAIQVVETGGHVSIGCRRIGLEAAIEVADDGPGIDETDRQAVFEPFFSRRHGGFGLGLSVVRQIVLAHHGAIAVGTSRMGGALFTVTLPLNRAS